MRKVRRNDYYSIKRNPYFSYFDVRFLLDLYTPLIGASATAVYLALQEDNHSRAEEVSTFSCLLDSLKLTAGEFEDALSYLEGIGLAKTYLSEGDPSYFSFELFPPYSPDDFFNDPLLYGMLLKYLGEDNVDVLKRKYAPTPFKKEGMEEISTSFKDRFSPTLDDPYFSATSPKAEKRKRGKIETGFELGAFMEAMKTNGSDPNRLNQGDLKHIESIAGLYGLSSAVCGELAAESFAFSPRGSYFDRDAFSQKAEKAAPYAYFHQEKGEKSQISSSTNLAKKIQLMDSVPPAKWLSIKQGGHRIASADLKLLRSLSLNMGLPNGVINALLDYCLERNNNMLNSSYVEKVAGALMREGCKTARDAMNYLKDNEKKARKAKKDDTTKKGRVQEEVPGDEPKEDLEEASISDEELDAMFEELGLAKKDKKPKN